MTQVRLFYALIAAIGVALFLYVYFVNVATFHTAERQHIEDAIIDTKSVISQLELEVIEANRNVTKEYAYAIGFTGVDGVQFVERDTTVSLSLNEI